MTIDIADFPSVEARARELHCTLPSGLVMLPSNFSDVTTSGEFNFAGDTTTAVKLLRAAHISVDRLNAGMRAEAFVHNRSADVVLPIIFVGTELLKTNPDLISLAIGVLQDYVLDRFKGITSKPTVKLEVVIEDQRKKRAKRISYQGDAEGLRELTKAVKALTRK